MNDMAALNWPVADPTLYMEPEVAVVLWTTYNGTRWRLDLHLGQVWDNARQVSLGDMAPPMFWEEAVDKLYMTQDLSVMRNRYSHDMLWCTREQMAERSSMLFMMVHRSWLMLLLALEPTLERARAARRRHTSALVRPAHATSNQQGLRHLEWRCRSEPWTTAARVSR